MPHLHRFYVSPDGEPGERIVLAGDEGRHASRVARVRVNDRVAVFDGCGREWIGRVEGVDRSEVAIVVDQTRTVERPADGVTILQAWLLRDKPIEELVRRATEIGVCGITFYPAARSEREVKVKDKLRKVAIEACKQCGRVWLPEFRVADLVRDRDVLLQAREDAFALLERDPRLEGHPALRAELARRFVGRIGLYEVG